MFGLVIAAVQAGLIRLVIPKIGEHKSVNLGLALYTLGFLLFAFASETWMMFAFTIPYCLGGIAGPALQGIISGQVPSNEQGELQGALTSLISATSIVGPPLMTWLFAYFTSEASPVYFAGAPFVAAAALLVISTFLASRNSGKNFKQQHPDQRPG